MLGNHTALLWLTELNLRAKPCADGDDAMHVFGFGFLIGCLLLASPASLVIAAADVAQADATQSPPQPTPAEEEDFLSTLD